METRFTSHYTTYLLVFIAALTSWVCVGAPVEGSPDMRILHKHVGDTVHVPCNWVDNAKTARWQYRNDSVLGAEFRPVATHFLREDSTVWSESYFDGKADVENLTLIVGSFRAEMVGQYRCVIDGDADNTRITALRLALPPVDNTTTDNPPNVVTPIIVVIAILLLIVVIALLVWKRNELIEWWNTRRSPVNHIAVPPGDTDPATRQTVIEEIERLRNNIHSKVRDDTEENAIKIGVLNSALAVLYRVNCDQQVTYIKPTQIMKENPDRKIRVAFANYIALLYAGIQAHSSEEANTLRQNLVRTTSSTANTTDGGFDSSSGENWRLCSEGFVALLTAHFAHFSRSDRDHIAQDIYGLIYDDSPRPSSSGSDETDSPPAAESLRPPPLYSQQSSSSADNEEEMAKLVFDCINGLNVIGPKEKEIIQIRILVEKVYQFVPSDPPPFSHIDAAAGGGGFCYGVQPTDDKQNEHSDDREEQNPEETEAKVAGRDDTSRPLENRFLTL